MLTCKEVTHLISESLDRDLPLRQRMAMRLHLLMCKFCLRYKKQLLFIRDAIRQYSNKIEEGTISPAISLSTQARQRIQRLLNQKKLD